MIKSFKKNNLRLIKYGFPTIKSYDNFIINNSIYYKYPYVLKLSKEEFLNIKKCKDIIQAKWDKRRLERMINAEKINKKERV